MIAAQPTTHGAANSPRPLLALPAPRPMADRLALAYQSGQTWVLAELHAALAPVIRAALASEARHARMYGGRPAGLDHEDVRQYSWLVLARLAERWNPALGQFGAYVNASMAPALRRYVKVWGRSGRPGGETPFELDSPFSGKERAGLGGEDGRDWALSLALAEFVRELTPTQRAAIRGLVYGGRRPGVSQAADFQARQAALANLRSLWDGQGRRRAGRPVGWRKAGPARPPRAERPAVLLLRALLATPPTRGGCPPKARCLEASGLDGPEYDAAISELVAAGVVLGRCTGRLGWLDHAAASRYLAGAPRP